MKIMRCSIATIAILLLICNLISGQSPSLSTQLPVPLPGPQYTFNLLVKCGTQGVSGVSLYIDDKYVGATDKNGRLSFRTSDGYHRVKAIKPGAGSYKNDKVLFNHNKPNIIIDICNPNIIVPM